MQNIDDELARETKAPLTKPVGNKGSIWFKLHFVVMMPALVKTLANLSLDEDAKNTVLDKQKTDQLVPFLSDVRGHVNDFHTVKSYLDKVIKQLPDTAEGLHKLLESQLVAIAEGDNKAVIQDVIANLPDMPDTLFEALQEQAGVDQLSRKYRDVVETMLQYLPSSTDDLGEETQQLLEEQIAWSDNEKNSFWGRIVQAHYAEKEQNYTRYGFHPKAAAYQSIPNKSDSEERSIYQRTMRYFLEDGVPLFPDRLKNSNGVVPEKFSVAQVASFFNNFLRKTPVVEMLHPSFSGAATKAAASVVELVDILAERTGGRKDFKEVDILVPALVQDTDLLRRIGRMAMAMDSIGNGAVTEHDYGKMNGQRLRSFAQKIWPKADRMRQWKNLAEYKPDLSRGTQSYNQDIATIIYGLAVNIEDHAASKEHSELIENLKELARCVKVSTSIAESKALIKLEAQTLRKASQALDAEKEGASVTQKFIELLYASIGLQKNR